MKFLYLLLLCISLFACKNSNESSNAIFDYKWSRGGEVVIDNGYYRSYVEYDEELEKMVGDTLFKIQSLDSTIILKYTVRNRKRKGDGYQFVGDTILTDTLSYDIIEFNGPKLLLYDELAFATVFSLAEGKDIEPTLEIPTVELDVEGFSVGDTIDRNEIEIKYVSNTSFFAIEEAMLIRNPDVNFEIVGDKYIKKIIRHNINRSELQSVIDVVNYKLKQEPKYTEPTIKGEYETEYYRWLSPYGLRIVLQRMDYKGKDEYSLPGKGDWTLYYENYIMDGLLVESHAVGKIKSSIIQ